jgi:hypothetical protein
LKVGHGAAYAPSVRRLQKTELKLEGLEMRSATKTTVSTLGVLMGIAGIEHGVGEILQGNIAPSGIMFLSWPESEFFRIVGGEPAMTVIPNLLATGFLAIISSLIFILWVTSFVQRKNGGLVLILLSIVMLLVGGGIFPPILGIIIGILGTKINAPLTWWRTKLSADLRHFLRKVWLWSFGACVITWLLLFPGINLFGYFLGLNNPNITVMIILFALGFLLLTIVSGFASDSERQSDIISQREV